VISLFYIILYNLYNYAQIKWIILPACLPAHLLTCGSSCLLAFKPAYLSSCLPACMPTCSHAGPPAYWHSNLHICLSSCLPACPSAHLHVGLLTGMQKYISACQAAYLPVCLPTCSLARRPAYYVALKPACLPVLDNSCLRHPSVCPSCLSFNSTVSRGVFLHARLHIPACTKHISICLSELHFVQIDEEWLRCTYGATACINLQVSVWFILVKNFLWSANFRYNGCQGLYKSTHPFRAFRT
jgi:hypothetical protein